MPKQNAAINMIRLLIIISLIFGISGCVAKTTTDDPILSKPMDELTVEDMKRVVVVVKTNYGPFRFALDPKEAPDMCRKFIEIARTGFYVGTIFREVRADLWLVGGFMESKNPKEQGYTGFNFEYKPNPLHNVKGAVGLWHSTLSFERVSSMFYIIMKERRELDGSYPVFGHIIEGQPTLDRIARVPLLSENGKPTGYKPASPVLIEDLHLEARIK